MPGFSVMPSIRVKDLPAAVAFYTNTLGFTVRRGTADEGNVSLQLGEANLMLESPGTFYSDAYNEAIRKRMGGAAPHSLYIEADDLDALYAAVQSSGATILDPLAPRDWGQQEFTVEDPEGNWLTFWKALA